MQESSGFGLPKRTRMDRNTSKSTAVADSKGDSNSSPPASPVDFCQYMEMLAKEQVHILSVDLEAENYGKVLSSCRTLLPPGCSKALLLQQEITDIQGPKDHWPKLRDPYVGMNCPELGWQTVSQHCDAIRSNSMGYILKQVNRADMTSVRQLYLVHPLLVKIIDTEQFQRLRELKQLGMSYYVYTGASHRRFEHCIGTAYLAGEYVQALAKRQPELGISRSDILCVMLAGLLHDLGHGPFSHTWERFMDAKNPVAHWKHEATTLDMFEHLLSQNNLRPMFQKYGIGEQDIEFIKEQIHGPLGGDNEFRARPHDKKFLYSIVSNKLSGLDVDKWDYLLRDGQQVNMKGSFQPDRFIKHARVIDMPDLGPNICFREKEVGNVYDMYNLRLLMHKRVYQHRVTRVLDTMMVEALVKADDHIRFFGDDGKTYKPSEAHKNMSAFSRMDDGSILAFIKNDPNPKLQPARDILKRINERRLYFCLGRTQPREKFDQPDAEIINEMTERIHSTVNSLTPETFKKNVLIIRNSYDYGKGSENPLEHIFFFGKETPRKAETISRNAVSEMLPNLFREMEIFVFYRSEDDQEREEARDVVHRWANDMGYGMKRAAALLSSLKKLQVNDTDTNDEEQASAKLENSRRRMDFATKK